MEEIQKWNQLKIGRRLVGLVGIYFGVGSNWGGKGLGD